MFRRFGPEEDKLDDLCRVEALVRDRFGLAPSEMVLVSQDAGMRPGFPPLETNVTFWKNRTRYRLKVFSPVAAVGEADLPVAWLLPALEDNGDTDCC